MMLIIGGLINSNAWEAARRLNVKIKVYSQGVKIF